MNVYVLDTSSIIGGFVPALSGAELVTVREVLDEAKALGTKLEFETALMAGKIKILEASKESLEKVRKIVAKTGDRVSDTDIGLLALALDLKPRGAALVTDDYAIQNLALSLDIPFRQAMMPGIKKRFEWVAVCPACKKVYPAGVQECQSCGTKLRRRPKV